MGVRVKGLAPREADVLRDVLAYLRLLGVFCWRNNTGGRLLPGHGGRGQFVRWGAAGSGDVFALVSGRFLSIECKRGGAAPTEAQAAWMASVTRAGGLAFVARSVEDVERALRAEGLLS